MALTTIAQGGPWQWTSLVDLNGLPISSSLPTSTSSSITNVAASATSVTLLAANTSRKGASVYNDSTAIMFLTLNASTSASLYTTQVPPNAFYEVPNPPVYTGAISALWASATGNARITELT